MKHLILTVLVATLALCGCHRGPDPAAVFYSEVRSTNKINLARMSITKMAVVDDIDPSKAEGMKQMVAGMMDAVKVGSRRAAYSYDTYLTAFIDLSSLTPEDVKVDESTKTVILTLPDVQTEFSGRDVAFREDHYRVSGLRSEIDARERADIKEQMNASLKKEVEEDPAFRQRLASTGRAKAEAYFRSLLERDGYTAIINFK